MLLLFLSASITPTWARLCFVWYLASKKALGKSPSKTKVAPKKPSLSPEDKAAVKIQSIVRMFLGSVALRILKEEKKRYNEMIEQIQKQVMWLCSILGQFVDIFAKCSVWNQQFICLFILLNYLA